MSELIYSDSFYKYRDTDTEYAAVTILNLVMKYMEIKQESIIDIGCGVGTWLKVANTKYNFETAIGLDGNYVPHKYLQIDSKSFIPCDLENYSVDEILIKISTKFDMALCLEVAEHVSENNAEEFIRKLCKLSDVVVFSAAVPKQGGGFPCK